MLDLIREAASGQDEVRVHSGCPAGSDAGHRRLALYVAELATLAPYRRRGLASALLAHAFDVAAAESYDRVGLYVDSENRNDAPSVYRRAGLEVPCAFHAYARTLSTHQTA